LIILALALAHWLALIFLSSPATHARWTGAVWFVFATLWLVWPVALVLYSRWSIWRIALSVTLCFVLLLLGARAYDRAAELAFDLPRLGFVRWKVIPYLQGYASGRADAKRDIKNNRLVIEEAGYGAGAGTRVQILRERYGIAVKAFSGCDVPARILGHAEGYNRVAGPEIVRRFGPKTVQAAWDEGTKIDRERRAKEKQLEADLAKSVSAIPADSNVALVSMRIWRDNSFVETDLPPSEMEEVTQMVHWIESLVVSKVPGNCPPFETYISAELDPVQKPKLEIQSHGNVVHSVHMEIYRDLGKAPEIHSTSHRLRVALDFQIR
jgi:hypothetical protein